MEEATLIAALQQIQELAERALSGREKIKNTSIAKPKK